MSHCSAGRGRHRVNTSANPTRRLVMAWSMLRSWLMGHEGQKSGRRRRPVRQRARSTRSCFRPLLECLESRLAPVVTPVLNVTTLHVTLSESGDTAQVFGFGVRGQIYVGTERFDGVESINITGNNAARQTVELLGNMDLTGNLSIDLITDFRARANGFNQKEIGGNLNITTAGSGSSIS